MVNYIVTKGIIFGVDFTVSFSQVLLVVAYFILVVLRWASFFLYPHDDIKLWESFILFVFGYSGEAMNHSFCLLLFM